MRDTPFDSIFDLSEAEGTNSSERFLVSLCRRSFLSLWSFPNAFTSEGVREDKSSGKEFIDVLVIFGDDVILFSDKEITFDESISIEVAWPRWFKRAVEKSVAQLYGARNWLLRFPTQIFLDPACKRPLPVKTPMLGNTRVHLVATTRGTHDACAKAFPGSYGSHLINSQVEGAEHYKKPFTVGVVNRAKPFVHVIDEFSLEVVMRELDTAADFVAYLSARERFLSDPKLTVLAAGEEQLLSAYLVNGGDDGNWFLPKSASAEGLGGVSFDESHFEYLRSSEQYKRKKQADRVSYIWDRLIETFIKIGDPKYGGFALEDAGETEHALRIMASESRFRRRILCEAFREMLVKAEGTPGLFRARLFSTKQNQDLVYVFLAYPRKQGQSREEYRKDRAQCLQIYCQCAPLRYPQGKTFIGIGVDHPVKDYSGGSEDLIVYQSGDLTDEHRAELRRIADEVGILPGDAPLHHSRSDDYPKKPSVEQRQTPGSTKKIRRKQAKASRRKNRK